MATKKRGKGKQTEPDKPRRDTGFDEVDDFFFGSETGSFQREEFDYDPFDDHAAISGRHEVQGDMQSTRVVVEVPKEVAEVADVGPTKKTLPVPPELAEPEEAPDESVDAAAESTDGEATKEAGKEPTSARAGRGRKRRKERRSRRQRGRSKAPESAKKKPEPAPEAEATEDEPPVHKTEEPPAIKPEEGAPEGAEEPVAEEPVAEEPPAEEPVAEEPPAEEPVAEEPPAEEPVAEEPPAEEPVAEEPPAEEPVAEEPVAEEPAAEEPVAEEPAAEEPAAAEEPPVEEPPADGPATEPVVGEPPEGPAPEVAEEGASEGAEEGAEEADLPEVDPAAAMPPDMEATQPPSPSDVPELADDPSDLPEPGFGHDDGVPLSERRAAGTAALAAMEFTDDQVFVGDEDDEGDAVTGTPADDVAPVTRKDFPAAPAPPPPSAPEAPEDVDVPGANEWSLAISELTSEADALSTKKVADQRAALLFEVGRILAHRVGDWTGAEARFEAALQAQPRYLPALRELVRLCAGREDWARAVDLLARQVEAATEPAGQTAALLASAHIQLSQLDRLSEAGADLARALEVAPDNYIAMRFLREIHYRTQAWTSLVEVLRRARDLADAGEQLRIDYELGRLHDEVLKAPTEAIDAFRGCLRLDGRFIPAFLAAERLLQEAGDTAGLLDLWRGAGAAWGGSDASYWFARAARTGDAASLSADQVDADFRAAITSAPHPETVVEEYRHWLESRGRWDDLATACEDALEGDVQGGQRAHMLCILGRVALQQRGDSAVAGAWYDQALVADPTCVEAIDGRRQILVAEGDWDGVLSLLAAAGEGATETRRKLAINLKMAEVAEVRLDDRTTARLHLEAACLLAPNYLPALDALILDLDVLGEHAAQAERLEQAAGIVDSPEARACYLLRASTAWSAAGERDKSITALQKSASHGPGSLLAREQLVAAYASDGRWAEAAETLKQAAAETDDDALKVSLLYRAGRIYLARVSDEDAAEAVYRSLLDLVPDFLPAVLDLRDIHVSRGDWDGFGLLRQQEAEACQDKGAKVWWHLSAGHAYERAGRVEDALGQYRAALEADPASPVANAALRRVYRSSSDHSALAESYGRQLRGSTDASQRDALRVQLLSALQAVGDVTGVNTEVAELLKSDHGDELPLAAAGILCEGMQAWDQAIAVYSAVGEHKGLESSARAACLFQQGLLLEEVREEQVGAAELYERAFSLAEGHSMALEGLERIHSQAGDTTALAAVYAREAELATSRPIRTFYALLAGEQMENLGEVPVAIAAYERAFDDPVGRERAYDALRRLALQARNTAVLERITEALDALSAADEAVARWMELGEGLAAAGDEDGATSAFRRALDRRPGFLPAGYHLERVNSDREDWNGVLGALELLSEHCKTASVRSAVEGRIQELLEQKGVTSDSAFDFYAKLREREPDNVVALKGLGGIHLSRDELEEARGCFEAYAEAATEPQQKAEAATQLGQLALRLEDGTDGAVARFEEAIEHNPAHRPALEELKRIHTESENWSSLVGVLARESSLAPEDRRLPFFEEIARIWQDRIDNSKVAVSSWQKVLQEQPDHAEAIGRLLGLYETEGSWRKYLDVADRQLAGLAGLELRDRRAELGIIAQERAGDTERAIGYFRAAVTGDQPSPAALAELRAIARARGDWEQVIQLSEQQVEVSAEVADKVLLLEEAARIKLDQLLDRDGAAGLFRRAINLDANCVPALSFFTDYCFQNEQWEDAVPVFRNYEPVIAEMDLDDDDDARIEATGFFYKHGVVLSQVGEDDGALERFAQALELTPTHLPSLEAAAPRYFEAGDWEKARATSRSILRLRGGTGDSASLTVLYLRLGRSELELGQTASALKRFKKALDRTPNHVEALQGIARIHRLSEDWNSLLSTYNSIIKYARDPDQVIQAYMTKGDVLEQKLQFTDKAVLHYEKVLMYDKTNWAAIARLGHIALRRGDQDKATEFAARASKAARDEAERTRSELLTRLSEAGDTVDAQAMIDELQGSDSPTDPSALDQFSSALGGAGEVGREQAVEAFRATLPSL